MKWHAYVVANPSAAKRWAKARKEGRSASMVTESSLTIDAPTKGEAITKALRMIQGATAENLYVESAE